MQIYKKMNNFYENLTKKVQKIAKIVNCKKAEKCCLKNENFANSKIEF